MNLTLVLSILTLCFLAINFFYMVFRNTNKDILLQIEQISDCIAKNNIDIMELKIEVNTLKIKLEAVLAENNYLRSVINQLK